MDPDPTIWPIAPTCDNCGRKIGAETAPDFHMDPETLRITCGDCADGWKVIGDQDDAS